MRPFRCRHRRRGPRAPTSMPWSVCMETWTHEPHEATGRRLVRFVDAGPQVLEIDLADVRYLSTDGRAALFTALRAARARGTWLVLTHANDRIRAVLQQIGLLRALSEGGRSTGSIRLQEALPAGFRQCATYLTARQEPVSAV